MKLLQGRNFVVVGFFLASASLHGSEAVPVGTQPEICATLEEFEGEIQLLSHTRESLKDTQIHSPVECGGWISVESGWAQLKHKNGFHFRLGPNSLAAVHDDKGSIDGLVTLFRGKTFFEFPSGQGDFSLVTANTRVSGSHGLGVLIYDQVTEETQVLCLDQSLHMQNRFEKSAAINLKSGETSTLNFKALRLSPSTPRATKIASVKKELSDFSLEKREMQVVLAAVQQRSNHAWGKGPGNDEGASRSIASTPKKSQKPDWVIRPQATPQREYDAEKKRMLKELNILQSKELDHGPDH